MPVTSIRILVSYIHFRIISFFDQISTNFRGNFDRCPFDELSFDENSTNGRVRRDVRFDERAFDEMSWTHPKLVINPLSMIFNK